MRRRALVSVLIAVLFLGLFVGCSTGESSKDGTKYYNFEDKESKKTLRVLLDVRGVVSRTQELYELSRQLENHYGLTDISFEWLPASGAERETIVERMKVEIMSGVGPDVFIIQPSGARAIEDEAGNHSPLFAYPEKVMSAGIFLPLDEYMENHSKLTDWNRQQQVVLAAGRNEEGQQLVPLSYSFPVLCYPQSTIQVERPETLLSWQDIIHDPEAAALYGGLIDCGLMTESGPGTYPYLDFVLGKNADFEKEELLFTEAELLQRVKEINSLPLLEEPSMTEWDEVDIEDAKINRDYTLTLLPLYADDGGITVSINAFAAINRNTQRPNDAYAVIDVLMSEYMQRTSSLANGLDGLPLNEDIYTEEKPIDGRGYLIEENYAELVDLREQITAANFHDDLARDLHFLLMHSRSPELYGQSVEEMVHETYEMMQRKVRE